jgi:hypothetical protein
MPWPKLTEAQKLDRLRQLPSPRFKNGRELGIPASPMERERRRQAEERAAERAARADRRRYPGAPVRTANNQAAEVLERLATFQELIGCDAPIRIDPRGGRHFHIRGRRARIYSDQLATGAFGFRIEAWGDEDVPWRRIKLLLGRFTQIVEDHIDRGVLRFTGAPKSQFRATFHNALGLRFIQPLRPPPVPYPWEKRSFDASSVTHGSTAFLDDLGEDF